MLLKPPRNLDMPHLLWPASQSWRPFTIVNKVVLSIICETVSNFLLFCIFYMELETEEVQMFVNRGDIDHRVDMFLPHPSIVMGNQQIGRITRQIKKWEE